MAEDITRRSEPTLYCRLHTKETYQLYCKDCQDFVCLTCLGEFHERHVFCRFQDVEEDIRNQFSMLFSENDNCIKRMDEFRQIIDQNMRQLSEDEGDIEEQIKTNAEKCKEQISLSEKYLLSGLKSMFKTHQLSSQELTTRVENIRTQVTKFNHVNAEKLHEYKLEEIINVLSELKACDIGCEEVKKYQKPKFNTDVKYGIEKFEAEVFEPINMSSTMHLSVSSQTDNPDDSDTEDEWFDADGGTDEDSIERSSDEIKDDNPLQIYKLNKDLRRIKKICPISHTDAWILADRQLYKMVNHALEDTVFADDADDIVVLKEGYVLVLRTESKIIMKLLENRRLVRFANVGSSCLLPYCLCYSTEETLSVYLVSNTTYQKGYKNFVVQLNEDGIVTNEFYFYTDWKEKPCLMQNVDSNVCVLYPRYSSNKKVHFINLLKAANNKCETIQSFEGILGYDPSNHFECQGICTDNKNIFVSDLRHHSVYTLDKKDLNYKKCVADARNGLDTPTAIAIVNNLLWIADRDQIFKFDLNNKKTIHVYSSKANDLGQRGIVQ